MATDKIQVGIIGASVHYGWSRRAHFPALKVLPEYELAAVCTSSKETAEESASHFGARMAFDDYEEMVRHPDVDVVVVSVKVPLHYSMVRAALEAGKHVFCEWPLGANLEETDELAQLARSKGVRNLVCLQARGDPTLQRLKELLAEGYVGQVLSCSMSMFLSGLRQRPIDMPWMADRSKGGNTYTIAAGHAIDAMCFCVGEFDEVSSMVATQVPVWQAADGTNLSVDSPDNVLVSGVLKNGAVASVHVANVHWSGTGWRMEVYGSEGTIVASSGEMVQFASEIRLRGGHGADGEFEDLSVPDRLTLVPPNMPSGPPFNVGQLYRSLGEAIQQGESAQPDFHLALQRYRMLDALQRSSDRGAREAA